MNLQLTKKLNDKFKKNLVEMNMDECDEAQDYHCNLIKSGRKNCILITHNATLFSFVLIDLKVKDFKEFEFILKERVFKILVSLNFSQEEIENVLSSMQNINYFKTNNRRVLGCMNEMVYYLDEFLYRGEDFIQVHEKLNNIPYKTINYSYPIEEFKLLLNRTKK